MNERPQWQRVLIALGKALCYLMLFLGWQTAVTFVYSFAISFELVLQDLGSVPDEAALMETIMSRAMEISLISGAFTLVSVAIFFKLRKKTLRESIWLRPVGTRILIWAALLSFCLYWLISLALGLLPEEWMTNYGEASAGLEDTGVLSVLATAVMAPVVEEVIFRGLIFTRLERALPEWLAVILSAAVFGVCHGEAVWFTYAFFLGTVFALLTMSTRSILPGMVMHLVFNSTNEVLLLLLGDSEPGTWFYMTTALIAIAGTFFCAYQIRRAVAARPIPFVEVEPGPPDAMFMEGQTIPDGVRLAPGEGTGSPAAPAQAMWDPDSGMDNRFPVNRL